MNNETKIIGEEKNSVADNRAYKSVRKHQLIYACVLFAINVGSTFMLYTHYGPLTENGNRYYHSFALSSLDWTVLGYSILASLLLVLPFLAFPYPDARRFIDVFPTKSAFGYFFAFWACCMNLITGPLFSFCYMLITFSYVSDSSRVMADDLETLLLVTAFIGCIMFWGVVDLIYFLFHLPGKKRA